MSSDATSSSATPSQPDASSLAPPLAPSDLVRSDSIGASRRTSGLTLHRILEIHFPLLSRFILEAELYPMLTVSKAIHTQIRREIAHAQAQGRLKWHRMRMEIEEQLANLKQVRTRLSVAEQSALDTEVTACCLQLVTLFDAVGPAAARCRLLIERGARVLTPDHELESNISELVRILTGLVETPETKPAVQQADASRSADEPKCCPELVEMLQLCFLSNPLLWRNKQYVGNGGYTLLEMLMETMLSRFGFAYGARSDFRMSAARATAEFLSWLIQLLLLQPAFVLWQEWRHMDLHLLALCKRELSKRACITSEAMLVTPRPAQEIAELKQLRWSIIRQCAGGPNAHTFSPLLLRLNSPLTLPSFHPHPLTFLSWSSDLEAAAGAVCPGCGLGNGDAHSLTYNVWICAACNFRMHCNCVVGTREAQDAGFRARTADEVQRMLQCDTPDIAPMESIPASVLDELRYTFERLFGNVSSVGAFGLMNLLLESSPSLCLSTQTALRLGPLPPNQHSRHNKSMVQRWLNGWMKDAKAKNRLLALLTGRSKFRSVVLQLDDPPNHTSAQETSSCSSSSSSGSSSRPSQSLPFACLLLFDLIRRKERRLVEGWLTKDRAYFTAAWPTLSEPTTGFSPLLYLVVHVRGCRQHVFTLLVRFTCDALCLTPAELMHRRNAAGQSLAEMLSWERNRDLRELGSDSVELLE